MSGRLLSVMVLLLVAVASPFHAVAATQSEEDGILSDSEYESPQFGFLVEWDDPWTVQETSTESSDADGYDMLTLDSDMARIQFYAIETPSGSTAESFMDALIEVYTEDDPGLEVIDRVSDEELAGAVVEYELNGTLVRDFTEVRLINRGNDLINISLVTPVDEFETEIESADDGVTLDGDPIFATLDEVDLGGADSPEDDVDEADGGNEEDVAADDDDDEKSSGTDELSPQYRGGTARTGEQPGPAPDSEPVVLWTYETGDEFGSLSPAVVDDLVFFGPNALYSVDMSTGELESRIKEESGFVVPPATDGNMIYATYEGGAIYAVDGQSGDVEWTYELDPGLIGGPAVDDGRVFVATYSGEFHAIDAETGESLWEESIESSLVTPAVVDGVVYVAGGNESVMYAFDAESGEELWHTQFGTGTTYGSVAVVDGVIFAPDGSGMLYALDAEDGTELWSVETGSTTAAGTPAVVAGVVYAAGGNGMFHALNAEDGSELWRVELDADLTSQAVVVDDVVFIGDESGVLYAFDVKDGNEAWSVELDGSVEGSPVIVDDVIYVDSAGTLYALGTEG
jgi:outer membrane protein assembly factor BamB